MCLPKAIPLWVSNCEEQTTPLQQVEAASFFVFLFLSSTFCTYKSWHRPNRRYPGVYLDMFHDRIKKAETTWPEEDFGLFWEARKTCFPAHLRLDRSSRRNQPKS